MTSRRIALVVVAATLFIGACGAGVVSAQPTELQPPDEEVPVLYPPDEVPGGEAHLVLLIDEVPIAVAWSQLERIAADLGGWISSSTSGTSSFAGERYEYVVAVVEMPEYQFHDFIAFSSELGRQVSFEYSTYSSSSGTITTIVTLTEVAGPFGSAEPAPSRLDQALDTAGDVLLTVLSVLIIGGAVILPVAILAAVAWLVWRAVRRRFPEPAQVGETDDGELIDA